MFAGLPPTADRKKEKKKQKKEKNEEEQEEEEEEKETARRPLEVEMSLEDKLTVRAIVAAVLSVVVAAAAAVGRANKPRAVVTSGPAALAAVAVVAAALPVAALPVHCAFLATATTEESAVAVGVFSCRRCGCSFFCAANARPPSLAKAAWVCACVSVGEGFVVTMLEHLINRSGHTPGGRRRHVNSTHFPIS